MKPDTIDRLKLNLSAEDLAEVLALQGRVTSLEALILRFVSIAEMQAEYSVEHFDLYPAIEEARAMLGTWPADHPV